MKKLFALLLSLLLLKVEAIPVALAESGITEKTISEQAFALGLACRMNDYDNREPDAPLLWDAAGWYAALRHRTDEIDLLSERELEDFLCSIGYQGSLALPEGWEIYGVAHAARSSDGHLWYDFSFHKEMFEEMLGISTEVHIAVITRDTAVTTVTVHYENDSLAKWAYRLRFEENKAGTGSSFDFRVSGIEAIDFEPQMEGALNFTWEELLAANDLSYLLRFCPAVCVYERNSDFMKDWYFLHNGETVLIHESGESISGQYGCYEFDIEEIADGAKRVRVGHIAETAVSDESIRSYLSWIVNLRLNQLDGDLFRLDCTTINGESERIAVNRGTLALEELTEDYLNYPSVTTCFDYTLEPPACDFLTGWEKPLRTITVLRESFESGELKTQEDFLRLPADWEYLPYEGRWGNYTIYMDAGYTKPYAYPGDGVDYTLYMTTAKG